MKWSTATGAGIVVAVGSYVAAGTRPFTPGADTAVIVGFLSVGIVMIVNLGRPRFADRDPGLDSAGRLSPLLAVVAVFTVVELVAYFAGMHGGRSAFPTISYLYDVAARYRAAKASIFAGWLVLGRALVRS